MVQLFKDRLLGVGSYGAVCKARSGELNCAAKIINPNLLDPTTMYRIRNQKERDTAAWQERKWFEEESAFLFKLHHPNLVQYLGLCQDPDTKLPVLLLELMDDSLTHFLRVPRMIPYHTQVNVCHDIATALSFLHSSQIIHKNLCSNNVLLDNHCTAKLTDFGMSMLADLNPRKIHLPYLAIQDKLDYMPPEAVKYEPVYTEKMDCFSFGVTIVQILTRLSPNPANRLKSITITKPQPGLPRDLSVPVSEVERRQNHIDLIARDHPLLSVALDCLKDLSAERPSAKELCSRISALKLDTDYSESVRSSQESNVTLEMATAHSKDRQILELQAKVDRLTKELAKKDYVIASSQSKAEKLKQQLEEKFVKSRQVENIERQQVRRQYSDNGGPLGGGSKESAKQSSGGQNDTCNQLKRDAADAVNPTPNRDSHKEGENSWRCSHCRFANHPLMSRCESCNCPCS